ncbi:HAD-IA family hydrolase [Streptomyces sp. NPDC046465]|uniref:HAD family hydrolase n=1 Tax=Streptomyces sp. NPDC046465 TaxID=3155810 RepID=UPI0033EE27B6
MTPDSTQSDTTSVQRAPDEIDYVRETIKRARFVLFDFDGPICRLFAGLSAAQIADEQIRWLASRGLHGLLTKDVRDETDPFAVLRAVEHRRPNSDLVAELEERLTQHELSAVPSAWPTEYADVVIRTWTAVGARLAITTNNSARTVDRYLESRRLTGCFAPHVYGRTHDLHLLKPHPSVLLRALTAMGADPSETVMVGDAPSDYLAARAAGVAFLGFARNERKAGLLREVGAPDECLVASWDSVLGFLRDNGTPVRA